MKRLSLILTLACFFCLSACSNSGQTNTDNETQEEVTTQVDPGASDELTEDNEQSEAVAESDDPFGGDVLSDEEVEDIMTKK